MKAFTSRRLIELLQAGMRAVAADVAAATDSIYVADEESSTVSVLDTSAFKLVSTIAW